MNYYNYSGRKSQSRLKNNRKKVVINILIIILIIALAAAGALFLGNYLKHRLESADISTEPVEAFTMPPEPAQPDPADEIDFVKNDRAEGEMSAVFGNLDLAGCPDGNAARSYVRMLNEAGYTGIVFPVRNDNGKYAYASYAASELSGTEASDAVIPYDILAEALGEAALCGMRSCAYIDLGDAASAEAAYSVRTTIDKAVVKELSALGFSEIIFDGLMRDHELDTDFAKQLYAYVSSVRTECEGTDFGLVIDPSVLEDPEKTPALEIVFRFVDFYSLDFRNTDVYTEDAISEMLTNYSGSFNAYSICALVGGSDIEEIRTSYSTLSLAQYPNMAFLSAKTDYEEKKDADGNLLFDAKLEKYTLTEDTQDTGDAAAGDDNG